ncbi:MAG: hypothetical protein CMF52_06730 [Legionellales bacterium]|nr:hypothetical protein [Legionellales bacterium]
MKVGDLVREDWAGGRLGVVVSKIRKSTPRDNHKLGVMYGDVHPVVDIVRQSERGAIKVVRDIETLELINESR